MICSYLSGNKNKNDITFPPDLQPAGTVIVIKHKKIYYNALSYSPISHKES